MTLARLGENVNVDLWNYKTSDGRSIRKALDFLVPFALGEKWTYQQLGQWPPEQLFPLMRRAADEYPDFKQKIPELAADDRDNLIGFY